MANNYLEFSSFMKIPPEKIKQAEKIVDDACSELDKKQNFVDAICEVQEDGVWFHCDESGTPEDVEFIAQKLINQLELDEPFYCSWASWCSKSRIDEFSGGAFVMKRGMETFYCEAMNVVETHLHNYLNSKKDPA